MKKIICIIMGILTLILCFTSCEKMEPERGKINAHSLYEQAMQQLKEDLGENALERNLEYDDFDKTYSGITDIAFNQLNIYQSTDPSVPAEIVICECMEKKDVKTVEKILNERAAAMTKSEDKAVADAWSSNTSVTTNGLYVCMCCMPQGVEIPSCLILALDK